MFINEFWKNKEHIIPTSQNENIATIHTTKEKLILIDGWETDCCAVEKIGMESQSKDNISN
jgi:hypothetical protein